MQRLRCFLLLSFFLTLLSTTKAQLGFEPVRVKLREGTVTAYKQSFALVMGVTNYQNGLPPLPGVSMDMAHVKQALEEHGFKVTLILDPDLPAMDEAFSRFVSTYGLYPDARLLFYFAGHGYTIKTSLGEELGYLVPADAPNPVRDPMGFQNNAMEMSQIEIYTKRIKSKHALFLFDACFSGSLFATSMTLPQPLTMKTLQPVREFITSGTADETVPDKSIFCSQFLEGLRGEADLDRDGNVSGTELGSFLQQTVINYSYETQHPQFGKLRNPNLDKGDFIFVVPRTETPPENQVRNNQNDISSPQEVADPINKREKVPVATGDLKVQAGYSGDFFIDDVFYQTLTEKSTVLFFNIPLGMHTFVLKGAKTTRKEVNVVKDQTNTIIFPAD
ncbi:MAG TPA: caspase family protein [Bacteroidales bacterium]|nr:caspase family protein [Bacteroidales bacterium]HPT10315.1 caspase family protein [Bacteroidales bacterium]